MCAIKDDNKDRNKWKLEIVEELVAGRDGVVRAVKQARAIWREQCSNCTHWSCPVTSLGSAETSTES